MNLAPVAHTAPAPLAASPAAELPDLNQPGSVIGTVKRVPFAKTLELRFGQMLGEFSQLYEARQAALQLSEGDKPAVAISTFASTPEGTSPHKAYVLYDVDYALKTRPFNPMADPVVVKQGDYHHGQVPTFGYESKAESWQVGAAQYIVDDGRAFNITNLDERS